MLDKIIHTKKPILITGETGTGKSQLAKSIHNKSHPRNSPFVKINLEAFPANLLESELFGHEKGSFTGALSTKKGLLESAGDGTVFIDEIGELALDKQIKLLHLLDDGTYYSVGSTKIKKFQGRFIFATNKDLTRLVAENKFRADLFFRMRFYQNQLPALRELPKDVLKKEIIKLITNSKIRYDKFDVVFSVEVLERFYSYTWPGNYRELDNTIEYLFALDKYTICPDDLPPWLADTKKSTHSTGLRRNYYSALSQFEKEYLHSIMKQYGGQINRTSEEIGLSKVTLISKLRKYGIDRKVYKVRGDVVGF